MPFRVKVPFAHFAKMVANVALEPASVLRVDAAVDALAGSEAAIIALDAKLLNVLQQTLGSLEHLIAHFACGGH